MRQEAVKAMRDWFQNLLARRGSLVQQMADLEAKRPEAEHQEDESYLISDTPDPALADLEAEIATTAKKIQVIDDTLSRARTSPELTKLAQNLHKEASTHRNTLTKRFPELLEALSGIREAYLVTVGQLGLLAQAISRQETLMNVAVRPYLDQEYIPVFNTEINTETRQGPIFIDGQIAAAYNPGHKAFTTEDAIKMLHPTPEFILGILEEE